MGFFKNIQTCAKPAPSVLAWEQRSWQTPELEKTWSELNQDQLVQTCCLQLSPMCVFFKNAFLVVLCFQSSAKVPTDERFHTSSKTRKYYSYKIDNKKPRTSFLALKIKSTGKCCWLKFVLNSVPTSGWSLPQATTTFVFFCHELCSQRQ